MRNITEIFDGLVYTCQMFEVCFMAVNKRVHKRGNIFSRL